MRESGMRRVHRVLTAMKMAEMAQLGARAAAAAAVRSRAAQLRADSQQMAPADNAADMMLQGQWQQSAWTRARALDAEAAEIDRDVADLKAKLARTMGREAAVTGLIERAEAETKRLLESRAEVVPGARA